LALARRIHEAPGLILGGLMTFPPMQDEAGVDAWLAEAKALLLAEGLPCPRISSGGTPNMWRSQDVTTATEHRAGTYIYNDRSLVEGGVCTPADCALTVLTTVVSRPTDTRGIFDAGSKVLTTDLFGLTGHGLIAAAPTAAVKGLSEEHGILDLGRSNWRPAVGARVRVIPNHACVVTNMMDRLYLVRGDELVSEVAVAARGKVT
jgi:D-serine deaminase-like pyridoxal phosphate-dependent protein